MEPREEPEISFDALNQAVEVVESIPSSPGQRTVGFVFTLFRPDPFWRVDLHGFPVLAYRNGVPVLPDSSAESPITVAINGTLDPDTQVHTLANALVTTVRRQAAVAQVLAHKAELESLTEGVDALDRISKAEGIALARAIGAGRRDEVVLAMSRWGFGVRARVAHSWLDRDAFVARVPFFARCYNELAGVRNAIDRIVSATVGVGPRIAGPSEAVRRIVEEASTDARIGVLVAHSMRDSLLMGASALVTSIEGGRPQLRLVRPDRLEYGTRGSVVVEHLDDGSTREIEASVSPETAQPGSLYGASFLEPWGLTLHKALDFRDSANEMATKLPPPDQRSAAANALAQMVETTRALAKSAEDELPSLLGPVIEALPEPDYPLYLRGRELWP